MKNLGRNWFVVPWSPPSSGTPVQIRPEVLQGLADELSDQADDGRAMVRVGLLRELVRSALEGLEAGDPGASVVDFDTRTSYRATIGRGEGAVWLESLSIEHVDGAPVDRETLRRVPVQQIAEATAQCIEENREPGTIVIRGGEVRVPSDVGNRPSSEELAVLMREGHNRRTLAAKFYRSLSTVDDWIGKARREVPELMPPPGKGGRPRKSINEPTDQRGTER